MAARKKRQADEMTDEWDMAEAEREMARSKRLIESGESYRSRKPSDYRIGKPVKKWRDPS
jgi:hypothetical protein